jgi:hypothetical protein
LGRTRIVKVSEEEYQTLKNARKELFRQGTNSLPEDLRREVEEHNRVGDLALGAIIGLGALALLSLFTDTSDEDD